MTSRIEEIRIVQSAEEHVKSGIPRVYESAPFKDALTFKEGVHKVAI